MVIVVEEPEHGAAPEQSVLSGPGAKKPAALAKELAKQLGMTKQEAYALLQARKDLDGKRRPSA